MPAIRYRFNQGVVTASNAADGVRRVVEVYGKGGHRKFLAWFGFICEPGLKVFPQGGFTTMSVSAVSNLDGGPSSDWRELLRGETVKCWWVPFTAYGTETHGVYTIVDKDGWPIIVAPETPDPLAIAA